MKQIVRIISILCVLSLIAIPAKAATKAPVEPRESAYLQKYNSDARKSGEETIKISTCVTGTSVMADIGVKSISIQYSYDGEYWYPARTFNCIAFPEIMGHNKITHIASVEHTGTPGRYYRAYITFWAGDGTNGDARYVYTNVVKL